MRKKMIVWYDEEEDILSVYQSRLVDVSNSIGDFVVDFDKNKKIVGIEMLNASEHLHTNAEDLEKIEDAVFGVKYGEHYVYLYLDLKVSGEYKHITIPLSIEARESQEKKEEALA